jgi:hypothetical protein
MLRPQAQSRRARYNQVVLPSVQLGEEAVRVNMYHHVCYIHPVLTNMLPLCRAYLCDRVRQHSKNGYTCHQVWHLEWANGGNRPRPTVGRDIQMRATRVKSSRPRAPDDEASAAAGDAGETQGTGHKRRKRGRPRTRRRLIAPDQSGGASAQDEGGEELEHSANVNDAGGSLEPPAASEVRSDFGIAETATV